MTLVRVRIPLFAVTPLSKTTTPSWRCHPEGRNPANEGAAPSYSACNGFWHHTWIALHVACTARGATTSAAAKHDILAFRLFLDIGASSDIQTIFSVSWVAGASKHLTLVVFLACYFFDIFFRAPQG